MVERLHPIPLRIVPPDPRSEPLEAVVQTAEALRELAAALNRLADDHHHTATNVDVIGHEVQRIGLWISTLPQSGFHAPLPRGKMRAQAQSSLDLAEHVSLQIAESVEAEKANPSTPPPDAAKVAAISKDAIAAAITHIKAENYDRLWKFQLAAALALLAALLSGAGWLIEHFHRVP